MLAPQADNGWAFFSNTGDFRRAASHEEVEYLKPLTTVIYVAENLFQCPVLSPVFCPVQRYPHNSPNRGVEYVDTPNGHRIELGHSEQLRHDDEYRNRGCSYVLGEGWGMWL